MMCRENALPASVASLFSTYKIGAVCQELLTRGYRDLRNAARGILMDRNIRSAPTLFSNTDLLAYSALGIIKYAFMPKRG